MLLLCEACLFIPFSFPRVFSLLFYHINFLFACLSPVLYFHQIYHLLPLFPMPYQKKEKSSLAFFHPLNLIMR
ncbi:hypothetical protein VNO80_27694 [Phaseolus coccineus]|uniref:Uncharacterized protein n=1 Tax=Phaseolus coccineus TaxID=3886 RepID=A0AAN9LK05_PHACN